jgi:hypothetical protein
VNALRRIREQRRTRELPPMDPAVAARLAGLPPHQVAAHVLSGDRLTSRWFGRMFAVAAAILVVWIVILAVTLPSREVLEHQDLLWVGFDVGLLFGLGWTAWAAIYRRPSLALAAAATGASLITDAWFDVVGSSGTAFWMAVLMAVVVELPMSALCWWIARHAQELAEQRISIMVRRWRAEHSEPDEVVFQVEESEAAGLVEGLQPVDEGERVEVLDVSEQVRADD